MVTYTVPNHEHGSTCTYVLVVTNLQLNPVVHPTISVTEKYREWQVIPAGGNKKLSHWQRSWLSEALKKGSSQRYVSCSFEVLKSMVADIRKARDKIQLHVTTSDILAVVQVDYTESVSGME